MIKTSEEIDEFASKVFTLTKRLFPDIQLSVGWEEDRGKFRIWNIKTGVGVLVYDYEQYKSIFYQYPIVKQILREQKLTKLLK